MARSFVVLFLLPETEVAMTTVISSHVKDKNCIFTGYESCVTGKIIGVYIIKKKKSTNRSSHEFSYMYKFTPFLTKKVLLSFTVK